MPAHQLSLGIAVATPPPGTWICGRCYCARPSSALWCSCLADPHLRDRLHALLDACDHTLCVPARPCEACAAAIAEMGVAWPPGGPRPPR